MVRIAFLAPFRLSKIELELSAAEREEMGKIPFSLEAYKEALDIAACLVEN